MNSPTGTNTARSINVDLQHLVYLGVPKVQQVRLEGELSVARAGQLRATLPQLGRTGCAPALLPGQEVVRARRCPVPAWRRDGGGRAASGSEAFRASGGGRGFDLLDGQAPPPAPLYGEQDFQYSGSREQLAEVMRARGDL